MPPAIPLPTDEQIARRLAQMLAHDSSQTGDNATTDRLMLMLTRSCELRCSYCFVDVTETAWREPHPGTLASSSLDRPPIGDLSEHTARRAVDLLMSSPKPRLSIQLFGGEPTRRWDTVSLVLAYATGHRSRQGRQLAIQLTTNGLGFDSGRLDELAAAGVTVQLSVDGASHHNRFRRPHLYSPDDTDARWKACFTALAAGSARWFLNVTVPPAAAGELPNRYADARAMGAPALQLNYATGLRFSREQAQTYLRGLAGVLVDHARAPDLQLFNRQAAADPAPLCGDVLCDVDGTLLQVGGIFHEKRFPALRRAYLHGHLDTAERWVGHRATLAQLWARTQAALSEPDADLFANGMALGAASDLVARTVRALVG
ncbi:MAG: radical SAM protein [Myxococcales bacterium]|nr:radical SAM protein [Myxococcales bacterium]